ncbi:hypothetical protein PSEWESI4_00508 [Pseudomonas carbonaria]|uniref:Type VI secretion system secreted protein VgrG n=1 Tax=Zestomonas carbonaria TaxID=2762745 RepID=A0A7U7EJN0_9GAMM|nr:hypothetical protein PSEWESI4_00508 [Pseudomonas carbonaria]
MQAGARVVITGPGGTITLDGSGVTLDAITIHLKGPIVQQGGGSGRALSITGNPFEGVENPPPFSERFRISHQRTGEPLSRVFYCVETVEGRRYTGHTDANGMTARIHTEQPGEVTLRWGRDAALYLRRQGIDE